MRFSTTFKGLFYLQKFNYFKTRGIEAGLRRTALYIRGACVRTIRVSPKSAPPNQPVRSRTRGGLRLIEAAIYTNGAIIGPIKFSTSNFFNEPVPHIHEFGGVFKSRDSRFFNYPNRSYMYHTLKQLNARGAILPQFSVSMARQFND